MASRKDFHYGSRLKNLVQKSVYTVDQVAERMSYASKTSLYRIFEQEWIKPDVIQNALKALDISEDDFYEIEKQVASDPAVEYGKPLYIEQRIDELEKMMAAMQKEIKSMKKPVV